MRLAAIIVGSLVTFYSVAHEYVIASGAAKTMPLVIALVGQSASSKEIAEISSLQLSASGQFIVSIEHIPQVTQHQFDAFCARGVSLVLFIEQPQPNEMSWRLYNVVQGELIMGRRTKLLTPPWLDSTLLCNELWPHIANKSGYFNSIVAACKIERAKRGERPVRNIYTFLPGLGAMRGPVQKITHTRSDNFAPRWHPHKMTLFFSQQTPTNIRLMAVDQGLNRRVITSFDGQNLTPAISPNGKVILSISAPRATHLYEYAFDYASGSSTFARLTEGAGYYTSPSFIDENTVVCEYMNSAGRSSIGIFDLATHKFKSLDVGRAHAPQAFGNKFIAYTKNVQGVMQIFVYDLHGKKERQISFSAGDKDEPTWSPCGNYLACSAERKNCQQIVLMDVALGREWAVTPTNEFWSYPSWTSGDHLGFMLK